MANEYSGSRLSTDIFERYLGLAHESRLVVSNDPWVEIVVHPSMRKSAVRTDAVGDPTVFPTFSQLNIERLDTGRGPLDSVEIEATANNWVGLSFLVAVAERLIGGEPFNTSILQSIASYVELFGQSRESATLQMAVGLFGELVVVDTLLEKFAAASVLLWWAGPNAGEHDFTFSERTIEVKTTLSEPRRHLISNLRQLEPVGDQQLDLVSVQLTDAPAGGVSLREFISKISTRVGPARPALEKLLGGHAFLRDESPVLDRRFSVRSTVLAFRVGTDFAPITRTLLNTVMSDSSHIAQLTYVLDLDGKLGVPLLETFEAEEVNHD